MPKKTIEGESRVNWTLEFEDDAWATPEFFAEFSRWFYKIDNIDDFGEWIADNFSRHTTAGFLEGAGPVDEMRRELTILDVDGNELTKAKYQDEEWITERLVIEPPK